MFESIKAWFASFRTKLHVEQEKIADQKAAKVESQTSRWDGEGGLPADMTPTQPTETVHVAPQTEVRVENPDNPIIVKDPLGDQSPAVPAKPTVPTEHVAPARKSAPRKAPAKSTTTPPKKAKPAVKPAAKPTAPRKPKTKK